jgi:hypothetical protein
MERWGSSAPEGKMRQHILVVALLLALSATGSASNYVIPTTTLAAQTSNNTSAANTFASQTNGNKGAGNISKVDVHSLLYPGATTKIYVHVETWFGPGHHMNIGYSSTDPAQVKRQIEDMISRGIDGLIIDWYGPNNSIDQATQLIKAEAENHPGFTFSVMIDQGAIQWYSCPGCDPQQALVNDLQYAESNYFISPAYMRIGGQPVITNFNVDLSYSVDWNAATTKLSTHPFYIFQNNSGFNHVLSNGSYSWVMPTTTDYGIGYLNSFYSAGMSFPHEQTFGTAYKGFNDAFASWGSHRVMQQQCGQTWLQTFGKLNSMYNSGRQLPVLQLVTWNDYEEATELESGIDNCLSISASVGGNALKWGVSGTGNENTVDHYTVYISADGQNLMPLTEMQTGVHSLNLCTFPVPAGSYNLFVQAVGRPSIANHITPAVSYTPTCTPVPPPPVIPPPSTFSLSATPGSITIQAGKSGSLTVKANPQAGAFNSSIALSCTGLPKTLTCSFSPAAVTPGANSVASRLTISPAKVTSTNLPERWNPIPVTAAWLLPFGVAGFAFVGNRPCRRRLRIFALGAIVAVGMVTISCGAVTAPQVATGPTPSSNKSTQVAVTIQGVSGSTQAATTVHVIVQ